MNYWQNKVAIVTGGSAGLGREIATALVRHGAQVVICGRDPDKLAEVEHVLQSLGGGGSAMGIQADVTKDEDVTWLVKRTIEKFGKLDLLVNNAGRSARGMAIDTTPEQFLEQFETNFLSTVRCTRAAADHLIKSGGHLVNIGSLAAKSAVRYLGPYPVSKFAVAAYSQQLRLELGPQGLHVMLVCPGPILREDAAPRYTEQAAGLPESANKPGGGVQLKGIPPQELATAILHACQKRQPELIMPRKARWLFAISQLWPHWGDRIILKKT